MIAIVGQLEEVGRAENGDYEATFVQPGSKRVIKFHGLTVKECQSLARYLFKDLSITITDLSEQHTADHANKT